MTSSPERAYCSGGPYDKKVYRLSAETAHTGKLVFGLGAFTPRNRPYAVYQATDRQIATDDGPAQVFEYDDAATQRGAQS